MAMQSNFSKTAIQLKWQQIINLVTQISGAQVGLVMKLDGEDITVHTASQSLHNPYHPGDREHLADSGLYCEEVVRTQEMLLVPDANESSRWKHNPDLKLNLISYLGFPISQPNGEPFGTICILDNKKNAYSSEVVELLKQARDKIEEELILESLLSESEKQISSLKSIEAEFRFITENISDVIWIINLTQNRFTYISPGITALRGVSVEEAMQETMADTMSPETLVMISEKIRKRAEYFASHPTEKISTTTELQQYHKNGSLIWIEMTTRYLINANGEAELIGISRNIEARKAREKQMLYASTHDYLTNLYNRTYLMEHASLAIAAAKQKKQPLSLLLFDLDYFKAINDQFGHPEGDKVLQAVSACISPLLRPQDIFARLGGDEFVVLMPEADEKLAKQTAEAIRQAIAKMSLPFSAAITASIGLAEYSDQESMTAFLKAADITLYQAKEKGRNQVAVYSVW